MGDLDAAMSYWVDIAHSEIRELSKWIKNQL